MLQNNPTLTSLTNKRRNNFRSGGIDTVAGRWTKDEGIRLIFLSPAVVLLSVSLRRTLVLSVRYSTKGLIKDHCKFDHQIKNHKMNNRLSTLIKKYIEGANKYFQELDFSSSF